MSGRQWLMGGLSIVVLALAALVPEIRQVAVACAIVVLPGYAVATLVLPTRELRTSELLTVVLATGTATLGLGGLLLTNVPSGVSRDAWLGLTGVLAVAAAMVAAVRRRVPLPRPSVGQVPAASIVVALCALVLAGGALVVARDGAQEQDTLQAFTELWALPGPNQSLRLGLTSHELESSLYRVDVTMDDGLLARWTGIDLSGGESWTTSLTAPRMAPGTTLRVMAFAGDGTSPMRTVVLHAPLQ